MRAIAPRCSADQIRRIAEAALGRSIESVEHVPVGWSNENWRVRTDGGDELVVKVGPPEAAAKWAATGVAYAHAARAGVPAPRLVHLDTACDLADGGVVRILTWIDGHHPAEMLDRPDRIERFFTDLGAAVRALHAEELDAFSSRLDGSAPRFDDWETYVHYRVPQIVVRARGCSAFSDRDLTAFRDEAFDLASAVTGSVRPALCHRDLHLDNLRASDHARLVAVLDFDVAEAWDPAVDMIKPRWQVFPHYPGARDAFDKAYLGDDGPPDQWGLRVRLAALLELVNTVVNARLAHDPAYEQQARDQLAALSPGPG
jgi:aminoglycoside phosphotransferase (APT) family kinase protein